MSGFREASRRWRLAGLRAGVPLMLLAGMTLPATPAESETLTEALGQAYIGNPTLQARRAELRATDENVPQALSGWRPTVTATASAGVVRQHGTTETFGIETTRRQTTNPLSGEIEVRQPVWQGGRTSSAVSAAENEVLAARALLISTEQDILLRAGTAYMNVLRDQAVVELNINNVRVLERQLEAAQDRFTVGEVTRTDVSQAESRVARAIADRRSAEGALEASRANYEQVVGAPPGELEDPSRIPNLPDSKSEAIERATRENPDVARATFLQRVADHNVREVTGELLPSIAVVGRAAESRETAGRNSEQTSFSATVDLTVPLYQSGAVSSRVRQAKQVASQRLVEVEQFRRDVTEAAAQAWENLAATRATIAALESAIEAQEIALEGVQQEAMVGTRTVLDVLDAEQELLDARVSLVSAQRDEFVATMDLASAVGVLTADALDLDVPRYDLDAYYESVRGKWFGLGD